MNKEKEIKEITNFLKIISEENRLKIIYFLKDGPKCVCEIWPFLNLPQNLVSHHLSLLKKVGLLISAKKGLRVFYKLDKKELKKQLINLNLFLK